MSVFTANKQASAFLRRQKFSIASSFIMLLLWAGLNIYCSSFGKLNESLSIFGIPFGICIICIAFAGNAYYNFVRIPAKCNHFIQSVEYDNGHLKLKTFPFHAIIPPRNLKAIEFILPENRLEIRRSNRWSQFSEREVFIILHEGEKYCLAPYYFDDFESMIHTIRLTKIESAA